VPPPRDLPVQKVGKARITWCRLYNITHPRTGEGNGKDMLKFPLLCTFNRERERTLFATQMNN